MIKIKSHKTIMASFKLFIYTSLVIVLITIIEIIIKIISK